MEEAEFKRALREKAERERRERELEERITRKRYLDKIAQYNTPGCNRYRCLIRRYGVKRIEQITAAQAKEYYNELWLKTKLGKLTD